MVFFSVVSASVFAGWELSGTNAEFTSFYVDRSSIRRDGFMAKMWVLMDFKNPKRIGNGPQFLSSADMYEFDCKAGRSRTIYFTEYSGYMGSGTVIASMNYINDWDEHVPGSIAQGLLLIACNGK